MGASYMLTFINYFMPELVPSLDSLSPLHCASLCSLHTACQSVFYQPATKACFPIGQVYKTTESLSRQSEWQYFVKKVDYPNFKVILKTINESAIYDWRLQEWYPFKSRVPKYIVDFSFDGGDDLYLCARRDIDLVSLKTGKIIQLGQWENTEYIYTIAVDLKSQYLFYVTLVNHYELNRMNPRDKNSSTSIYRPIKSSILWLTLDRDKRIVFATGPRETEYRAVSMKYDGSEAEDFALSTEKIKDIVFDKQDNALMFTTPTEVYSYILSTKKKVKISSRVSSPKQIDIFGDFIFIVNETKTHSSLVVLSRMGKVLYDLKNPNGCDNNPTDWPSRIQVIY